MSSSNSNSTLLLLGNVVLLDCPTGDPPPCKFPLFVMDSLPPDLRKLRACLVCKLIKNFDLFKADGCDNCERFLDIKGSNDRVLDCTTANFTGFVAVSSPAESWVAKWLRIDKCAKGVYAMRVNGTLPEDLIDMLNDRGIKYPPEE